MDEQTCACGRYRRHGRRWRFWGSTRRRTVCRWPRRPAAASPTAARFSATGTWTATPTVPASSPNEPNRCQTTTIKFRSRDQNRVPRDAALFCLVFIGFNWWTAGFSEFENQAAPKIVVDRSLLRLPSASIGCRPLADQSETIFRSIGFLKLLTNVWKSQRLWRNDVPYPR